MSLRLATTGGKFAATALIAGLTGLAIEGSNALFDVTIGNMWNEKGHIAAYEPGSQREIDAQFFGQLAMETGETAFLDELGETIRTPTLQAPELRSVYDDLADASMEGGLPADTPTIYPAVFELEWDGYKRAKPDENCLTLMIDPGHILAVTQRNTIPVMISLSLDGLVAKACVTHDIQEHHTFAAWLRPIDSSVLAQAA